MSDSKPVISQRKKVSFAPIMIIPFVSLLVGVWMVVHSKLEAGPTIKIAFDTANGIEAGKTKVQMLNVAVGLVEDVALNKDATGVIATVTLDKSVEPLLKEDTRFWVVRARVGTEGVSGLGTLFSGAYIELSPGDGEPVDKHRFEGMEAAPVTAAGTPGKHLTLVSEKASIGVGDPILFQGFTVGRVETVEFDSVEKVARYDIFVHSPYDDLIHDNTRFWDVSGLSIGATADGVKVNMGALESVIRGGASFGNLPNMPEGKAIESGEQFRLYGSYSDILARPYRYGKYYVINISQPLTGLDTGAPVSFRGIQIGRVERILIKEIFGSRAMTGKESSLAVPVLIYVEPGRLGIPDSRSSLEALDEGIRSGIGYGLRATLKTGSVITGKKLIYFDYYSDDPEAQIGQFQQYTVLPSLTGNSGSIEDQFNDLMAKINAMPLEDTVTSVNRTLDSISALLEQRETTKLPENIGATLEELRYVLKGYSQDAELYQELNSSIRSLNSTLENVDRLTRTLSDQPSSILFSTPVNPDIVPKAAP
ncbi:MAG: hypothetical protein CL693_20495 [Cellvibrionaceae bacterium]|nr:hypothetical protein [Cellvibrionaceae bacterium]|tara:strand:- start:9010 stop:10617 length:1608 start_codon:yes stop_codon:yes gene_type:complete